MVGSSSCPTCGASLLELAAEFRDTCIDDTTTRGLTHLSTHARWLLRERANDPAHQPSWVPSARDGNLTAMMGFVARTDAQVRAALLLM